MDRVRSLNVVAEMLSHVSSKQLRRLVLNLQALRWIDVYDHLPEHGGDENEKKHAAWMALDDCLAGCQFFPSLELVDVLGSLPSGSTIPTQDFRSEMALRLPSVRSRGILNVRVSWIG